MNIQQALQWTDELIFVRTGKHLDSLERVILKGAWEGKGYQDISEEYHCTNDHVRKSASELWTVLSELLGEDVKKKNVRSLIEREIFTYYNDGVHIGDQINVCNDLYNQAGKGQRSPTHPTAQPRHDLSQAPEYLNLHSRTAQLATLKQWICQEKSRIITLTGLSGIGKTALTRQLVEQIKDHFDHILWRSHRKFPTLTALQNNILDFLTPPQPNQDPPITNPLSSQNSLINHLRSHRCLIILDDFHETLTPGELVGHYHPNYQDYGHLIHEIGQLPHNSCLLLLTWEQPLEITTLQTETPHCRTLRILGLETVAIEILKTRKLQDEQNWPELIERYSSNPLWLNLIASTILDLFNGSVQEFLAYPTLFLGDVEPILQQHYQRLSATEKILLQWLADQNQPVKINQKPPELLSDSQFLRAIQSLKRRSLIDNPAHLSLQPAIKQYVENLNAEFGDVIHNHS
ncbi:NB-ARC domain-containing protein [Spirulina sp. CCNP1310]|uniref:NB-ARC domain-containing protein n=1 Tax=Spirulina sp. CCNP1310 TaxID=3110249 RepID=UPI002B1EBDC5|nr:NB-ARC domain-containing protein [Spirulina sp. CCNP1310]MEA5417692.1 NB-ARC domain-containing protein [Spirulina sp. CCNP1310]